MINLEKIENEFNNYTSNYDIKNERIKLKIEHIKRVANNSKIISQNLNLSDEQINLAITIGYLHDIGRFEQVRISNTFSDKESGIDHSKMAIKILFSNNLIRKFIDETKYDEIIKKSILNHNKPKIENDLTDETLLFCKIIRDADKLDILYTISQDEYSMESIFWYKDFNIKEISEDIIDDFKKNKHVNYSKIKTNADIIVIFYAFIFDIYFNTTKEIIFQKKYLELFTQRVIKTFPSYKVHEQTKELLKLIK